MNTSVVVVIASVIAVCSAHLCLISPAQRGSLDGLNTPGASNCFLTKWPCGGRVTQADRRLELRVGQEFVVVFQKNLSHWNVSMPGVFMILIGREEPEDYMALARIPDKGEPDLTIYTVNVNIPTVRWMNQNVFFQVSYITYNGSAPAFYQCADVKILP